MENFKPEFVTGTSNYRVSNAQQHAKGKPHRYAFAKYMQSIGENYIERRKEGQDSILKGLRAMEEKDREETRKKFDTAYFIAKEELPLAKFDRILDLEERHNVAIGNAYRNSNQCGTFVDYIADEMAEDTRCNLDEVNFFSTLFDGATDASIIEKETLFTQYLDVKSKPDEVEVITEFLGLEAVPTADAEGIVKSIKKGFANIGKILESVFLYLNQT